MFLRSISILLLLVGCGLKLSTLHIPYQLKQPPAKLQLIFTSKLQTPWQIGFIENEKREPITIDNDITKCVRTYFLQKLPKPKKNVRIEIILEDFKVVVRKRRALGYAKFHFEARWQGGVAQKDVVVRRVAKIQDQKDLEAMVVGMCKEAARIVKEQYALLGV